MKGIIFQVYEEFAANLLDKKRWTKILEAARISVPFFVPMDDYHDTDLVALIKETASATGKSSDQIEHDFGIFVIPKFAKSYDFYFKPHSSAKEFLLKMDEVHQVSTQTIAGAKPPRFHYESPSENSLIILYSSARKMCNLMKGLVEGVASHYKERVKISERCCMKKNAPRCELVIDFRK